MNSKVMKGETIPFIFHDRMYTFKLDMNALEALDDIYGDFQKALEDAEKARLRALLAVYYAGLKISYTKDMTFEEFKAMGISDMAELGNKLKSVIGEQLPQPEDAPAGEAQAALATTD